MYIGDFIAVLIIALVVTAFFALGLRRSGPWDNLFWFFIIVFLAAWVGGLWMAPYGPPLWGIYWLPILVMSVLIALLLAAATPTHPPRNRYEAREQLGEERALERVTYATVGVFFWLLLLGLIIAIVVRYV